MLRFMSEVSLLAHDNCEHAGRTQVNLNDLVPALSALGTDPLALADYVDALPGAARTPAPAGSGPTAPGIPFCVPITSFPVQKSRGVPKPSFKRLKEHPPSHIPRHLPAFPDLHTRQATAVLASGATRGEAARRNAVVRARRAAEQSLTAQALAQHEANRPERRNPLLRAGRWEVAATGGAGWETQAEGGGWYDAAMGLGRGVAVTDLFRPILSGNDPSARGGPSTTHRDDPPTTTTTTNSRGGNTTSTTRSGRESRRRGVDVGDEGQDRGTWSAAGPVPKTSPWVGKGEGTPISISLAEAAKRRGVFPAFQGEDIGVEQLLAESCAPEAS